MDQLEKTRRNNQLEVTLPRLSGLDLFNSFLQNSIGIEITSLQSLERIFGRYDNSQLHGTFTQQDIAQIGDAILGIAASAIIASSQSSLECTVDSLTSNARLAELYGSLNLLEICKRTKIDLYRETHDGKRAADIIEALIGTTFYEHGFHSSLDAAIRLLSKIPVGENLLTRDQYSKVFIDPLTRQVTPEEVRNSIEDAFFLPKPKNSGEKYAVQHEFRSKLRLLGSSVIKLMSELGKVCQRETDRNTVLLMKEINNVFVGSIQSSPLYPKIAFSFLDLKSKHLPSHIIGALAVDGKIDLLVPSRANSTIFERYDLATRSAQNRPITRWERPYIT